MGRLRLAAQIALVTLFIVSCTSLGTVQKPPTTPSDRQSEDTPHGGPQVWLLTTWLPDAPEPGWTPTLVATAEVGDKRQLWGWRTGEQTWRPLSDPERHLQGLHISPEGGWITLQRGDHASEVWILRSNGQEAKKVLPDYQNPRDGDRNSLWLPGPRLIALHKGDTIFAVDLAPNHDHHYHIFLAHGPGGFRFVPDSPAFSYVADGELEIQSLIEPDYSRASRPLAGSKKYEEYWPQYDWLDKDTLVWYLTGKLRVERSGKVLDFLLKQRDWTLSQTAPAARRGVVALEYAVPSFDKSSPRAVVFVSTETWKEIGSTTPLPVSLSFSNFAMIWGTGAPAWSPDEQYLTTVDDFSKVHFLNPGPSLVDRDPQKTLNAPRGATVWFAGWRPSGHQALFGVDIPAGGTTLYQYDPETDVATPFPVQPNVKLTSAVWLLPSNR